MNSHAAATHYTAGEVAAATGIPPEKQLQWHDRSVILPSRNDVRPNGTGDKRLVSRETVYQLAITGEAIKIGLSPNLGGYGARIFTEPSPGRRAATLYPRGRTILIFDTNGPALINCELDAELAEFGKSFVAIDLAAVCNAVDEKLNKLNKD
jgi:hypothetical protein